MEDKSCESGLVETSNDKIYLDRPSITKLISNALEKPFTIVVANAGFGKSLVIKKYLEEFNYDNSWIQFSTLDNLVSRFWEHFIYTIANKNKDILEKTSNCDFPDSVSRFDNFLNLFIQLIEGSKKYILVFDDFHLITEKEVLNFIQNLMISQLANLKIIIISRKRNPKLRFDGIVTKNMVSYITENDLAFTKHEINQYFKLQEIKVSDSIINDVHSITKGWVFAVYLIARSFKNDKNNVDPIISARLNIYNLIEYEIFEGCSEKLQKLLVKLSFLDTLNFNLVKELANDKETIDELLDFDSFVIYNSILGVFTIHNLFLEFLISKQVYFSENEVNDIYAVAANWYEKNNYKIDAMIYYEKSKNYNKLFDIILTYKTRISKELAEFIIKFIDNSPKELLEKRPMVLVSKARKLLNNLDFEGSSKLLLELRTKHEALPLDTENKAILGEIYIVLAFISFVTNTYDFVELFRTADEYLPNGSTITDNTLYINGGNVVGLINKPIAGEYEKYQKVIASIMPFASRVMNGCGYGIEHLVVAEAKFLTKNFEESEKSAYLAMYSAQQVVQYDIKFMALFFLIRINLSKGNYSNIKHFYDIMREESDNSKEINCTLLFETIESWFNISIGRIDEVSNWIKNIGDSSSSLFSPISSGLELIVCAKYLFFNKEYHKLQAFIEKGEKTYGVKNYLVGRIQFKILKSLGLYYSGDHVNSISSLKEAYELAYANFIIMPFIECGNSMRTLIGAAKKVDSGIPKEWLEDIYKKASTYAKQISNIIKEYESDNETDDDMRIDLSAREKEVLVSLCRGLTREEIATSSNLSINTVKTIFQNIYSKLGATNSANAVKIAISKGLDKK